MINNRDKSMAAAGAGGGKSRLPRAAFASLAAALIFSVCLPLAACARAVGITFAVEAVSLFVGEVRDLLPYARFEPSTTDNKSFTLSVDGDSVEIDGTSVRAVKPGTAVVTATAAGGKSASMEISVEYKEAVNLSLEHTGEIVQTTDGGASEIMFAAVTDDFIDPATECEWLVNGVKKSSGREFAFTPDGYGIFLVTARLGALTASERVLVYRPTTAVAEYTGSLDVGGDYAGLTFYAKENIDTRNPRTTAEWRVNGEIKHTGLVFDFVPQAKGEYVVELYVNGVKREFTGGGTSVTVKAGDRAPTGAVEFDDCGGARITWKDGGSVRSITVTAPSGTRTTYSQSDIAYAYLFGDGYFDATDIIEVCADDTGEYKIRINADAQGPEFTFTQYGTDAKAYLDDKLFMYNRFISSADDAAKYIEDLYACFAAESEAYLARGVDHNAVLAAMQSAAARLKATLSVERDGNILSIGLTGYANVPNPADNVLHDSTQLLPLYASLPHIEYDRTNRRPSTYAFAVDRSKNAVGVTNSEQLLLAVLRGANPEPATDGLRTTYRRARAVLIGIIGADYTDEQKVHAIYDWLQWYTHKIDNSVDTYGRFVESVFGGGITALEEVTDEGAAKCFALMCGIEGIPCTIERCEIGGAARYINRVELDGVWYNVDVFGGEVMGGAGGRREICSHFGLLFGDATLAARGYELFGAGDAFDESRAAYLDKTLYSGAVLDYYIDGAEKTDYASIKSAVFAAFDGVTRREVTFVGVDSTVTRWNDTFGAEFVFDPALTAEERASLAADIRRAADEFAEEKLGKAFVQNAVSVYTSEWGVHIIAQIPRD